MTLSAFWHPDPHSPAPRRALLLTLIAIAAELIWVGRQMGAF